MLFSYLRVLLGAALAVSSQAQCVAPIDLVIALDKSNSVGTSSWLATKVFLQKIVNTFVIGPDAVSVSIVTFATDAELIFGLGAYVTASTLHAQIESIPYIHAGGSLANTCSGKAMKMITEEVLCPACANLRAEAKQIVLFLTDSNPSTLKRCSTTLDRTIAMDALKARADRIVPIGIGSGSAEEYLASVSFGMPAAQPYILAEYASLDAILLELAGLACPTLPPTKSPTLPPSGSPTKIPTASPTAPGGCDAAEWAQCDQAGNGLCACGDATCSFKQCSCAAGWGCDGQGASLCSGCSAAPTKAPTNAPTEAPTKVPTSFPTHSPTKAPTSRPTRVPTVQPTTSPIFPGVCLPADAANCDPALGLCSKDDTTGAVKCSCHVGYGCNGLGTSGCSACTVAPTLAPTQVPTDAPSAAPTKIPTATPSAAPTQRPTWAPTVETTLAPTFGFGCSPTEVAKCDQTSGICFCKDTACTAKQCGCADGKACADAACAVCTAAPTSAPSTLAPTSVAPTSAPTPPTVAPTYWALFNEGDDSIDNRGVSAPTVAVGAGLGALAIVAIVAAVIAAVVVAVMATAGIGIFAFKQVLFEVDSDITVDGMEMVSVFVCLSPSVFRPPPPFSHSHTSFFPRPHCSLPRCVLRRPSCSRIARGTYWQPAAKRPPSAMVLTPEQVAQMGLTPAGSTSEILPSYENASQTFKPDHYETYY